MVWTLFSTLSCRFHPPNCRENIFSSRRPVSPWCTAKVDRTEPERSDSSKKEMFVFTLASVKQNCEHTFHVPVRIFTWCQHSQPSRQWTSTRAYSVLLLGPAFVAARSGESDTTRDLATWATNLRSSGKRRYTAEERLAQIWNHVFLAVVSSVYCV